MKESFTGKERLGHVWRQKGKVFQCPLEGGPHGAHTEAHEPLSPGSLAQKGARGGHFPPPPSLRTQGRNEKAKIQK